MTVNSQTKPHLLHNDNTVRLMKTAKKNCLLVTLLLVAAVVDC